MYVCLSSFEASAGDERYKKETGQFDWYQRWAGLAATLDVPLDSHTLVVGCGNSRMAEDMVDVGYKSVTCIDVSCVVVEQMAQLYATSHPSLRFARMNACALDFPDESFDAAIAKATLDVIMCGDAANVVKVCHECSRVLRPGGLFAVVSLHDAYLQFLDPDLANQDYGWTATHTTISKPALRPHDDVRRNQVHHVYLCRKHQRRSNTLVDTPQAARQALSCDS